ncbi:MAG: aminoglycoside phosphotransferase family protein [Eubacteriales bacterium]|nr:aminoglycoside phosphotransferase family protein [Eubacteriales bacterium]
MERFTKSMDGWADWGRVFQDTEAFSPLAEEIFRRHGLPFAGLSRCAPGSNAVFRAGGFVVKIFAPLQSGVDTREDFAVERFAMKRAQALGVPVPAVRGEGCIQDRYAFNYLILDHIAGISFGAGRAAWTAQEKERYAACLRGAVDKMDTPCPPFRKADPAARERARARWGAFPRRFQAQREALLAQAGQTEPVFVHLDLNPDNLIAGEDGQLYLLDFADANVGAADVELAPLAELFRFEQPFLAGYFGQYDRRELTEKFVRALLMHDYGYNIIRDSLCAPQELKQVGDLYDRVGEALDKGGV